MENGYPVDAPAEVRTLEELFSEFPTLSRQEHLGQIENMLESIAQDRIPMITGIDGRNTIELIMEIYQSAFTGLPVKFPMTKEHLFYAKEGILHHVKKFHEKKKSVENFSDQKISVGGSIK
jgi:dihydrodipicolinate synthase/N-acetylneuraminate lyase